MIRVLIGDDQALVRRGFAVLIGLAEALVVVGEAASGAEAVAMAAGHHPDASLRETRMPVLELSIGDYVLSGGELAAAVLVDAIARLIPGVLNDETSALTDSFQDNLLAPPVYTRPADFRGWKVPEVLLSGDPQKIAQWRDEESLKRTLERRPGLYERDNDT